MLFINMHVWDNLYSEIIARAMVICEWICEARAEMIEVREGRNTSPYLDIEGQKPWRAGHVTKGDAAGICNTLPSLCMELGWWNWDRKDSQLNAGLARTKKTLDFYSSISNDTYTSKQHRKIAGTLWQHFAARLQHCKNAVECCCKISVQLL